MNARLRQWMRGMAIGLATLAIAGPAAAQGVGIKGGLVFPSFDTARDFELENRIGFQVGLFLDANRDGVVGFQTEFNYLRREVNFTNDNGTTLGSIETHYAQVPLLLRINAGTDNYAVYAIGGPSFEVRFADSVVGFGNEDTIDSAFENFDVAIMFGGGIEIGHLVLEGRYSKGLREISRDFQTVTDLKVNSFAALVGFRF